MAAMDTEKNTSGGTSTDASPKASAESAHLKGLQSLLNFLQVEVESRDMSSNDQQDDIGVQDLCCQYGQLLNEESEKVTAENWRIAMRHVAEVEKNFKRGSETSAYIEPIAIALNEDDTSSRSDLSGRREEKGGRNRKKREEEEKKREEKKKEEEEKKKRREEEEKKKEEKKKKEEEKRKEVKKALEREQAKREEAKRATPRQPFMAEARAQELAAAQQEAGPSAEAVYARRLRQAPERTEALKQIVEKACHALGISAAEERDEEGAETWGTVLRELGDFTVSEDIVAELKSAYEYQGFDARLIAQQMKRAGVSALHRQEGAKAGAFMDRLTLVVIGLMRGANLDKVRKGMKEANRANFDILVKHFGIQSKPVDSAAITLPRVIATFPGMAMDVLKIIELGPVRHSTMTNMVAGYPRALMFSAFPSLIPRGVEGVTEALLSAYLLFQHQVSLVINPDYPKWDLQKQRSSLEGFARAAMDSDYVTQRQRVLRLVEEGWLSVDQERKVVSLTPAIADVVNAAAVQYQTRK
ncbi:N protein [Ixodes scapularis]